MIKINIVGDFFSNTGYGWHTRNLANALNSLEDVEVAMTTFNLPPKWNLTVNDEELQMFKRSRDECNITLCITLPYQWLPFMSENKKFIGFCVWEGDKVPKSWLNIFSDKRCDMIFVPSKHTKRAIINTEAELEIVEKTCIPKIKVIPHGVNLDTFKLVETEKLKDDKFRFVFNGGWVHSWNDRKGTSHLVKAYCEEFNRNDPIELMLKINSSYGCNLNKNLNELKLENKDTPIVNIILNELTKEKLNELYNSCDVGISTSKAEGFNMPLLECMACGKPVITTDFGGQMEFCSAENSWILKEGELKENKWDLLYEGVSWKDPSIDEIRKTLRYVYEHKEEIIEKGKKALETSKQFTWKNSANSAYRALLKI